MTIPADDSARLQTLVDLEEIRRLKHRYVNLCDDGFPARPLAELFVEEGLWTGPADYGRHEGRAQLEKFFEGMGAGSIFTVHMVGNEEIEISGDTATGRWTTIAPCTFRLEGKAEDFWGFLRYENEFVRRDGRWWFSKMQAVSLGGGLHRTGWADSVIQ